MAFESKYLGQQIEDILTNIGDAKDSTPIVPPRVSHKTTEETIKDMERLKKNTCLLVNDTTGKNMDPGTLTSDYTIGFGVAKYITETDTQYEIIITRILFKQEEEGLSYITYSYLTVPKIVGESTQYKYSRKRQLYTEKQLRSLPTNYINIEYDSSIEPGVFNVIQEECTALSLELYENNYINGVYYLTFITGVHNMPFDILGGIKWTTPLDFKFQYKYQIKILDNIGTIQGVPAYTGDYNTSYQIIQKNAPSINTNVNDENKNIADILRGRSFRCVGKYVNGKMYICRLHRYNTSLYYDGTAYNKDDGDVFLRPCDFYLNTTTINGNFGDVKINIDTKDRSGFEYWSHFFSNQLIGVYKAYNQNGVLRSISGVTPTTSLSYTEFKNLATTRGAGYHLVTVQHHKAMSLLYLLKYKYINARDILGTGSGYSIATGYTDSMGMKDTSSNDSTGYDGVINFWGLEGWFGDISEWTDGVSTNDTGEIIEDSKVTYVNIPSTSGYIKKMFFNASIYYPYPSDLLTEQEGSYDGWYGYFQTDASAKKAMIRAGGGSDDKAGMFSSGFIDPTTKSLEIGSRLAYTGEIIEVENVQEFKAL